MGENMANRCANNDVFGRRRVYRHSCTARHESEIAGSHASRLSSCCLRRGLTHVRFAGMGQLTQAKSESSTKECKEIPLNSAPPLPVVRMRNRRRVCLLRYSSSARAIREPSSRESYLAVQSQTLFKQLSEQESDSFAFCMAVLTAI